jgi:hypothetical protein
LKDHQGPSAAAAADAAACSWCCWPCAHYQRRTGGQLSLQRAQVAIQIQTAVSQNPACYRRQLQLHLQLQFPCLFLLLQGFDHRFDYWSTLLLLLLAA